MNNTTIPSQIKIDKEFQSMIPPLTEKELSGLEESILHDGCLDPLIVWQDKNILLDGHHRKTICEKYGLEYDIRELRFESRDNAADWIDTHQLGRRNLTPEQMSLLRGRLYNRRKRRQGGTGANRYTKQCAQNERPVRTADKIAEETGVSQATIRRDGEFAEAVERLGIENKVNKKQVTASKQQVVQTAKELSKNPTPWELLKAKEKLTTPHIANNAGDNEWYTPAEYIERACEVMNRIDLDPSSCQTANKVVKATTYYSKENNGLCEQWAGHVWMNPPYAQPAVHQFCDKLVYHVKTGDVPQAMVLVNNATETKWGQLLLQNASAVCFPSSRVKFWHPEKISAPLQGQMIVYFGKNIKTFSKAFQDVGVICYGG
jgi:ParB family chromosome partitioning protein